MRRLTYSFHSLGRAQAPRFLLLVLAIALIPACTKPPALIEVGERRLSEEQLEKRVKQIQLLQPAFTRVEAAIGMIEGWASDAVLEKRGNPVTADDLEAERTKVASDEKIAKLYKEVAKIFGTDQDTFVEVGLLPDMSIRKLHAAYAEENAGNQGARDLATAFLSKAQIQPDQFAASAATLDAKATTLVIASDGQVKDATGAPLQIMAPTPDADRSAAQRLVSIARTNKDGQVLGLVSRTTRGFMIVKKMSETPDAVQFEAVFFEKIAFAAWLTKQAKDVRVCIADETLRFQYQNATRYNLLNCR